MRREAGLSWFMELADSAPPLSQEEERRLCQAYQETQDPKIAEKILRPHFRDVLKEALKNRGYKVALPDLVSEGLMGLFHALSKFDIDRGPRFISYARHWIRAYIIRYIIRTWSVVSPDHVTSRNFFKLRRMRGHLLTKLGDADEANRQLAERTGISTERLGYAFERLDHRDGSLDAAVFEDGTTTKVDLLRSGEHGPEEKTAEHETELRLRDSVRGLLDGLETRERRIVEERLMCDAEDRRTLSELGTELGLSKERVRQLEEIAKKRLRARLIRLWRETEGELFELDLAS